MSYLPCRPVEPMPLVVGQTVRLDDEDWTVRAVTENFAAATRPLTTQEQMETGEDGPMYTVLDWRNGVRGPCDLIGQAWGDGTYTEAECAAMLADFEAGEIEVSARNWVWL